MILFVDVESTGLPNNYRAPSSAVDNWPRVVSIAYVLKGDESQSFNYHIIKPNGFVIPDEATTIHGITTGQDLQEGVDIRWMLQDLILRIERSSLIVAHNIDFDSRVIGAEFIRAGFIDPFEGKPQFCTMKSATNVCRIQGPYGFKWPKLEELHRHLFESEFEGAHGAAEDVLACEKCFWELKKMGVVDRVLK